MQLFRLPYVHRDGTDQKLAADWDTIGTLTWQRPAPDESADSYLGEILKLSPMKPAFSLPDVLVDGQRNVLLLAYAGQLIGQGKSASDVLVHLQLANMQRCQPPLEDEEIQRIAHSIGRYQVTEENLNHLINFRVKHSIIFEGSPSYVHLFFDGETRSLKLTMDQLEKLDAFKSAYLNKFTQNQLVVPSGKGSLARWAEITYLWRKDAKIRTISEQASNAEEIALRDWLMDVEAIQDGTGEHLDKHKAILLPERFGNCKIFRLQSLLEDVIEMKNMSNNELGQKLEEIGCRAPGRHTRLRLTNAEGRSIRYRVWIAPECFSPPLTESSEEKSSPPQLH